jgi:dUTP pyrophosphatase
MEVKIKKLELLATIPTYANPGDAGMDITAISMEIVSNPDYGYIEYKTGLCIKIPEGYAGLLFPRSSISNTGMMLSNSIGVIDSGYRGEIKFRFKYIAGTKYYKVGDKIGQLVIVKTPHITLKEVEELDKTERGERGFGSSDKTNDIIY